MSMKLTNKAIGKSLLALLVTACMNLSSNVVADEKEDLTVLRNTVVNLLQTLVQQGVMSQEQARNLVQQAQDKAEEEVAAAKAEEDVPEDVVRVQYVPDIVKEEIRNQVRAELKAEVVADVVSQAKRERWGVKDALPSWLNKIKISGDMRVRGQGDLYDSGNVEQGDVNNPYLNASEINSNGPLTLAELANVANLQDGFDDLLVTDEDRIRERIRLRLNLDAKINEQFATKIRLTTGNTTDPVSTNQTLGEGGNRYDIVLDRAYIQYKGSEQGPLSWLTAYAGRMPNPWHSTDLVWDDDLGFEGLAATGRYTIGGNDLYGSEFGDKDVFLTMGAFPLEEYSLSSSRDKWLLGAQIGTSWKFANQSSFKLSAAYYDYINVQADPAPRDTDEFNASLPQSLQKGNSLFFLNSPNDPTPLDPSDNVGSLALASDYELINLTAQFDYAYFAPYNLRLTADYVKNIGYESSELEERLGTEVKTGDVGYHLRADFGWPRIANFGHWNIFAAYKHLERDAVLDAFTDSDFHLGGTDAEGWELGANFGLAPNAWLSFTYRSANEIDGIVIGNDNCNQSTNINCNFGIDVIQLDLNARY